MMTAAPTARNAKNARITIRRSVTGFPSPRGAGASPDCPGRRRCPWRHGEVQVTADPLGTHHAPATVPRATPGPDRPVAAATPVGGTRGRKWPAGQAEGGEGQGSRSSTPARRAYA